MVEGTEWRCLAGLNGTNCHFSPTRPVASASTMLRGLIPTGLYRAIFSLCRSGSFTPTMIFMPRFSRRRRAAFPENQRARIIERSMRRCCRSSANAPFGKRLPASANITAPRRNIGVISSRCKRSKLQTVIRRRPTHQAVIQHGVICPALNDAECRFCCAFVKQFRSEVHDATATPPPFYCR